LDGAIEVKLRKVEILIHFIGVFQAMSLFDWGKGRFIYDNPGGAPKTILT
jgi:hypothetical protein